MAGTKIRGEVMNLAAITEKQIKLRLDSRGIHYTKEPDVRRFMKQFKADCDNFVDLVERLSEKGDPSVDLQTILNKLGDLAGMGTYTVRCLYHLAEKAGE